MLEMSRRHGSLQGRPIGQESDFPLAGKVGGLQGVGVAANGDVWIADATKNQMLYFPGGRVKDERLVQVNGLKSPFGVAIDAQNRVWVSNAQSNTVVRFPADDPSKAESFNAGIGVRGVALDSKGNLWVASNMSSDFPPPSIPDGVSIMKQFQLAGEHMMKVLTPGNTTGVVNMIRPRPGQSRRVIRKVRRPAMSCMCSPAAPYRC
jgi:DNA-binding beta-propeller fold protein YncE